MWGHRKPRVQVPARPQNKLERGSLLSASQRPFCSFLSSYVPAFSYVPDSYRFRKVPEETKWYSEIASTFKRWLILRFHFLLGVTTGRQYST